MGLYDNVKVFYPLPDPALRFTVFQTKDFNCMLEDYTIMEDGRLIYHPSHLELLPENERDGMRMFTRVRDPDVEITDMHGDIFIIGGDRDFTEYRVRFTHGRVERIDPLIYDDEPA